MRAVASNVQRFDPLDAEQIEALKAYAAANGRSWKSELWIQWMNASADQILHSLRNTHGPAWLVRFKLETPEAPVSRRWPS